MYSFNELRKVSKTQVEGKEIKVAVLGNASTQFFSKSLEGFCKLNNLNAIIFDADYNQIDLQLFDNNSETYHFQPDYILIWMASEMLYEEFLNTGVEEKPLFAEKCLSKIKSYWGFIKENTNAKIIQFNFSEIDDRALGNYSAKVEETFIYQLRKLNYLLSEAMIKEGNVFPIDISSVQNRFGFAFTYNPVLFYSSKMSTSIDVLPYISKQVVDVIKSSLGLFKKCLIMDLDNTIWGGVIGDDGINNIEIGELGRGHVFSDLQRWIKQLKEFGIILAVCSKNNEKTAKEPFEKHPDMILRLSDISIFVANWDDKASNIKLIQESLNIGMDSIVFIDDNPFERELVKNIIPDICVPDLPDDPSLYLGYLQEQNLFEAPSFAGKNSDRTMQYQAQFERKKMETAYSSIDGYLKDLEMVCSARSFEETQFSRIAQLSQRSNQFNLRTVRYTDEDIKRIANDKNYITLSCSLKDKFGDYGLVSVVIIKKTNANTGFVDTWLMSCRALKRGLEEFTVNKMISLCKENGVMILEAEYIPTPKNNMVKDIYSSFGFKREEENRFCIDVNNYQEKNNYIKEIK